MEPAFELYNKDNFIALRHDMFPFSLVGKFTVSTTTNIANTNADSKIIKFNISGPYIFPVLAVRPPLGQKVVMRKFGYVASTGRWEAQFTVAASASWSFTVYIYDKVPPKSISTSGMGLQLFNSNNELTFDAEYPYLRALGALTHSGAVFSSYTGLPNRLLAVVTSNVYVRLTGGGGSLGNFSPSKFQMPAAYITKSSTNETATFSELQVYNQGPPVADMMIGGAAGVVVDVTGH